jgi:hypothetical protein
MRDEFGDLLASCIEWEVIMNQLVKVNKLLDDFYVEMETRLLELLAIPSVQGEAAPGAPFGLGPDKALQYCLDLAKQMGFTITNFDGYMGIVDLPGQINEQVGILSHVDVVPAVPEDWKYHPFQPVVDDVLHGPSLATVFGHTIRAGSPYETLMGNLESQLKHEALWRAGRPGMACTGVNSACTEYGHLGGAPAVAGRGNITQSLCPVEMKVTFSNFHRVIQGLNYGHKLRVASCSYLGGYAGSAEGSALACVADDLLVPTIMQADYTSSYVYDIQLFGNCGRKGLWANSVSTQAISRNTGFMRNKIVNETGGPCTEMLMYETAIGLMNHCVSGASKTTQPRSAGGRYTDYITPVECWWSGEVFKSCAGMTRKQANEIAKKVLPKYEDKLSAPDKGLSIYDCYDLKTQRPLPNYSELYNRVRNELIDLGMPLDKVFGDTFMGIKKEGKSNLVL